MHLPITQAIVIYQPRGKPIVSATISAKTRPELVAKLCSRMDDLGVELSGFVENPKLRAQLQGAPKFRGVSGPQWDGDGFSGVWRYTLETNQSRRLPDE